MVAARLGLVVALTSFAGALAIGCSASSEGNVFGGGGGGATGTSSGTGQGGGATGTGGGISVGSGGGGQGGSDEIAEVFGHSPGTLYRLDPTTKTVTVVGDFQGCSDVIDIALDKASNLYGTTFGGLYEIDKATAQCTQIALGGYPNSLSFVPEGTVDPIAEALVGYVGSDYVRIDTSTGAVTTIGSIGGGYASSGDIVSVKGGKTLLTVTGGGCADCIIEVNPTTGALVKNYGQLGYGAVFGLAFWAGSAYGFSDAGQLFEVTFVNDVLMTSLIPIPSPPPNLQFWGAGSTTSAPPTPIPD